ncbi:MAG: tetratricopeptide repeat protein [Myxococcota bacterium]
MTEFHLDGLIDAQLDGRIDPVGEARLEAHRKECEVCQLEAVFRTGGEARDGDEARLHRIFDGLDLQASLPPAVVPQRRSRRWLATLAIAAAVLTGSVSAWAAVEIFDFDEAVTPEESSTVEPTEPPAPAIEGRAPQTPAPPPPPEVPEPAPEPEAPTLPAYDGADTFRRANTASRAGRHDEAARLYREVVRREPSSARGLTARVSLGRVLLSTRNARGALRQFDAYLAARPGGALAEEALVGRARALSRLGRRSEERETWRQLLERYPNSLHRSRAEQRLLEESDR